MLQYERIILTQKECIIIRREESVLVAIALLLFAGVILFNVFTNRGGGGEKDVITSSPSNAVTSVTSSAVASTSMVVSDTSKAGLIKVNINTADVNELMTIKGIGETKAQAIVDYRNKYGPFPTVDALTNVSGIGEKTLLKIKDCITV